jgi:PAS domain S-box-containing protein
MLRQASRQAQALRESEERFHGIVDSAFEGWVVHRDGVILLANSAYAATFGYTSAQLVGRNVLDLAAPEARAAVAHAIRSGDSHPRESIALRQDGTQIPIETAGQNCTFDGQPARVVAVRDLTAQKQAAANQLVLSKIESTGILAGGLAHDFNNLLAMQVLNLDLALLTERLSPAGIRCLQAAKNATETAKTLTQQLVTFSRGSASVRQPTDLPGLLAKTVPLTLSGANVRGEVAPAPGLWRVDVDPGQIERVVGNLVLNAREAMASGGTITLRAVNLTVATGTVPMLAAGDYVRLDVIDRGPGIAPDILPKIFDPTFPPRNAARRRAWASASPSATRSPTNTVAPSPSNPPSAPALPSGSTCLPRRNPPSPRRLRRLLPHLAPPASS